jgi:hypothetical protein
VGTNPVLHEQALSCAHKRKQIEANCPKNLQSPNEDDTLYFTNMNIKWENGKDFASILCENFFLLLLDV